VIKKNLKLLIALTLLIGLSVYIYLQQKTTTLKKELTDFAIKDTAIIDKFFIADKAGNKVLLEKKDNYRWLLNGRYYARPDVVKNFLSVVCKLQVSSPVAKNAFNNIVKQLATTGIKVELYSKGNNLKTFYVGGANQTSTGTYMMLENSSTPFAVTIPGFEGYLTPNFSSKENIWRSTTVFDYNYNEINKVNFTNYTNPKSSFSITRTVENQLSKIKLVVDNKEVQNFDTAKVNTYLLQFRNLNYEAISDAVRQTRKDSAMQMPIFKIDILATDGIIRSVTFYKKPVDKGVLDDAGNPTDYDIERMFTIIDGKKEDFIVTQYYVFEKIFKAGKFFLK